MGDLTDHIIHLANGQLAPKSSTTQADVARIINQAVIQQPQAGLAIHFHGGLVSEKSAREMAARMNPIYSAAGAYPLFFVWESGLFEAIGNNLQDISKEKIFHELVKKVAEWAIKKLPAGIGFKGAAGVAVNEIELRQQFDEWFQGSRTDLPDAVQSTGVTQGAAQTTLKGVSFDQASLETEIQLSIESDFEFQDAINEVFNGLHDGGQTRPVTKGAIGTTASSKSLISPQAADKLFDRTPATTKGFSLVSWYKTAKMVASIVMAVAKRFKKGRAHGLYVTVVEETLRSIYLDKVGTLVWNQMKKDTADAFLPGENHGGTALLSELKKLTLAGTTLPRITLIGHSTGAIYICNFIDAASQMLPGIKFDVVFLAPAVTYERFAATLANHAASIRHFRSFGMTDEWESEDKLVPILYIRSLLYFVSGLLEENIDEPLVGMERFLRESDTFAASDFPAIARCRNFYSDYQEGLVWSPDTTGDGTKTSSAKHGDFDNDEATLKSLQWLLQNGF